MLIFFLNISVFKILPYNIEPYQIILPVIKSGTVYSFTTDSKVIYEVRFGRKQNNILNATIVFGVTNEEYDGEEYSLTNKGEVYKVMTTIVEIVQLYKQEHPNINLFEYTGEQSDKEKSKNRNVRLALYSRYIKRVFDTNWIVETIDNKVIIKKIK
ncbi:MAG: hypothetical protein A3K10_09915 [Bacteroidetes bacterium RIFCSPLOWO2_12_FULL_31_6]|nr:MAG: hypothetical protein A3K10_09915 [Bacteroidetes bacterium RIFCSPLOWO2_12_FULL_31_6]